MYIDNETKHELISPLQVIGVVITYSLLMWDDNDFVIVDERPIMYNHSRIEGLVQELVSLQQEMKFTLSLVNNLTSSNRLREFTNQAP